MRLSQRMWRAAVRRSRALNADAERLFGDVLAALSAESQRFFQVAETRFEPLELIERPFSHVLRARARHVDTCSYVFLKRFKLLGPADEQFDLMRNRVVGEFASAVRVHDLLAAYPGLNAVRPIACFPDALVIATEQAGGETLTALLERRAAWRPSTRTSNELAQPVRQVGLWIRTFQAVAAVDGRFDLDDMRTYLDTRLLKLVRSDAVSFGEEDRQSILRAFDGRAVKVDHRDLALVPIHADLSPANILISDRDVTVLDFARSASGGLYHDVARMYTQLEFLKVKPTFAAAVVDRLNQALLDGFDSTLRPDRPLFQLFCLQHVVCHLTRLSLTAATGWSRFYNWRVRRQHRLWLDTFAAAR